MRFQPIKGIIICALLSLIFLSSCTKDDSLIKGTLKDYTGLDGCGWVIVLDKTENDGTTKLEPTNLGDFGVTMTDGQKVKLTYTDVNAASVCMVGKVVKLQSIQNR